jgi:hypothetical protein
LKYFELLKEAFDHQASRDKQDQRQHHLGDDKATAEAAASPKQTNRVGCLLERSIEIKFRALQGGGEGKKQSDYAHDKQCESENASIHPDVIPAGDPSGHSLRDSDADKARAPVSEHDRRAAGKQGQQHCFSQEESENNQAAGSHSAPDSYFPLPPDYAGQEQVGNIGTGQQQYKQRRSLESQEERRSVAILLFAEPLNIDVSAKVRIRVLLLQSAGKALDKSAGLGDGDSISEATKYKQRLGGAFGPVVAGKSERDPEVSAKRVVETVGHYSGNSKGIPVETDSPA